MAATGYLTHAAKNRRQFAWVVGLYLLSFQMIGGLVAMLGLMLFDPAHMLLVDPFGYFARYALPIALIAGAMFWWIYQGHAESVAHRLAVVYPSRIEEPRFIRVAEEQCIALGVRQPRFGILEVPQPNALAVGEGPARGLIAVTRGLLDQLDDDELAAVIAHQASHIRQGDTRVLAANYALMRTAVLLQVNNALRFEDWRLLLLPILFPPMLLIMLLSGMITMASMQIARMARQSIKLSRFHICDGEAVRVTHRPDALHSALVKIGGKGAFTGSEAFDDLLFDGRNDSDGGSHPAVVERLQTIAKLGRDLMQSGRTRRDTRAASSCPTAPVAPMFGRRIDPAAFRNVVLPKELPRTRPRTLSQDELLKLILHDWKGYKAYLAHCSDFYEWRESDQRNFLGLKPEMRIPLAGVCAFMLVLYWPSDGNWRSFANRLSPGFFGEILEPTRNTFCSGPSYPNGKCMKR